MTKGLTLVRVITWLPVGGIERRLVSVVPRLRELGWSPHVVLIREEGPLAAALKDKGIPVEVIPFKSRMSPPGVRRLARYLKDHDASVVHSHMYRSNIPATLAGRLAGTPAVFSQIHNVDSWDSGRQIMTERLIARFRTGTFAVSHAVQRDVMDKLRLVEEKVPILYNGVDVEEFTPRAESGAKIRAELGIGDDRLVFLVPARLHPQKNPLHVLAAMEKLVQENAPANPILVFAGAGKLEEEVRAKAEESLGQNAIVLGKRDDMALLYNAADAIVLSSKKEGFSNAVVESLACGKPVIASDVGGNKEAVSDVKYGWIHDSDDTSALAKQMREACELGRDGLGAMAEDCRKRALDFSVDSLVRKTHEYYCNAIGREP